MSWGKQASLVLLCVSVPAWWVSRGCLAGSTAHRSSVQDAHPRKPGVRNREFSEIDAHFYEIWLSWGFWQISCSLSKAGRVVTKSPGLVPPCCSGGHMAMLYISWCGRESSKCY